MKIISYNVNGIRAAMQKGFNDWLKSTSTDILCLQEIKAEEHQIDIQSLKELGYEYIFTHSAQKKGYSGVAILSKEKPLHTQIGTGIDYMDNEGRVIRCDFEKFSVISLYLPSGTNIDRLEHKFKFMDYFQLYINELKKEKPNLIICGDYNICHQAIDIHDPIRNAKVSGFLPEERLWLDNFIKSGFVDSFRHFNPNPHQYSWWTYRANARQNNKGWRIDYCLVSENLKDHLTRAFILPEAYHSDHCPVGIEIF